MSAAVCFKLLLKGDQALDNMKTALDDLLSCLQQLGNFEERCLGIKANRLNVTVNTHMATFKLIDDKVFKKQPTMQALLAFKTGNSLLLANTIKAMEASWQGVLKNVLISICYMSDNWDKVQCEIFILDLLEHFEEEIQGIPNEKVYELLYSVVHIFPAAVLLFHEEVLKEHYYNADLYRPPSHSLERERKTDFINHHIRQWLYKFDRTECDIEILIQLILCEPMMRAWTFFDRKSAFNILADLRCGKTVSVAFLIETMYRTPDKRHDYIFKLGSLGLAQVFGDINKTSADILLSLCKQFYNECYVTEGKSWETYFENYLAVMPMCKNVKNVLVSNTMSHLLDD